MKLKWLEWQPCEFPSQGTSKIISESTPQTISVNHLNTVILK
jgi:hypothetical protein